MADFAQLLAVLGREKPERPVLFEFGIGMNLVRRFAPKIDAPASYAALCEARAAAFEALGYDYVPMQMGPCSFPPSHGSTKQTRSLNENAFIADREAFEAFSFPDADAVDASALDHVARAMPKGMRIVVTTPGGVLENAIELIGYDNLCLMLFDDPELLRDICDRIGGILLRYFERAVRHPAVGAIVYNDDWGFSSQTLIAPRDLRRLVFPWCERIIGVARAAAKPVILHSCGQLREVMEDIIAMGFAAKHSYEDKIWPVEEAYECLKGRIAVLGGIDVDFLTRASGTEIEARGRAMLARARDGGYALGSGNSIPDYVPEENFLAMLRAAKP